MSIYQQHKQPHFQIDVPQVELQSLQLGDKIRGLNTSLGTIFSSQLSKCLLGLKTETTEGWLFPQTSSSPWQITGTLKWLM